ncbi:recombinase family protein [Cytobacillus horneckiae]|uniref:Recombinase family protein n=1 Tax=Cytobacillus horneckiae TaxID=549687 RepID=A0A2N0ZAX5_9BACI|nr:recombinase family protein [Cytobacillus horneckiae]MEC1158734.1 recombinase family protein [Cytobacillus horneckiae]NRG47439.1 recombinase family protein [Bacillus sp. CRN 9]PKG26658.1 recombinase family protein [Cytobacillus horneckiae]
MSNIYGYIRVSTKDQNEARQFTKMINKGVEARKIFVDKLSGKDFNRPQYQLLKKVISVGDLLYIDALDRLGRNYDAVISEWKTITRDIGADIVILENESLFDSRKFKEMGDMGKLMEDQFLSLLSYVADQERKKIKQRQREGIENAKRAGKHLGRPSQSYDLLNNEQKNLLNLNYAIWKERKLKSVEFMDLLKLKKNTFYKIIKEYENIHIKNDIRRE